MTPDPGSSATEFGSTISFGVDARIGVATGQIAVGTVLAGRFRVIRFLAAGGMGEVYEAHDNELDERVAIKILHAAIASNPQAMARFRREVQLGRQVAHPSVCRCHDIFHHTPADPEHPPLSFLSMELLIGIPLSEHLRRQGPLAEAEAWPIIEKITAALEAAHDRGIVHRDLKASNVILVPAKSGMRVVVTDFGLARMSEAGGHTSTTITSAGMLVGTPAYMAPEQLTDEAITPATDVYALGVLVYEMVTGRFPFAGETPRAMAMARLSQAPVPPRTHVPELDAGWEQVILGCLEREPGDRFAHARKVAEVLASLQDSAPERAERAHRPRRSRLLMAALAGAGLGALLIAWNGLRTPHPAPAMVLADAADMAARPAVAVMELRNLADDEQSNWLAPTLAVMLTTELARGRDLRVLSDAAVTQARQDLDLDATRALDWDTLARVREHLGAELVVTGGYYVEADSSGRLRVDLRIEDTSTQRTLAMITEEGHKNDLFDLVARAGYTLRAALGLDQVADETQAGMPRSPEAARLYAEGLKQLRSFDAATARSLFEQAMKIEPAAPFLHAALADSLAVLGHDADAARAAKRAHELGTGLKHEARLRVTGRYYEASGKWPQAIDTYLTLAEFFPDEVEHGLRLAAAYVEAGQAAKALPVIAALRKRPPPASHDPRIDLAEAHAAYALADYPRARDAAEHARERSREIGARGLRAEALLELARARWHLGETDEAEAAADVAGELFARLGNKGGQANAIRVRANLADHRRQPDKALTLYREAMDMFESIGQEAGVISIQMNMALVMTRRGELDEALELCQEAQRTADELGQRSTVMRLLYNQGWIHMQRGNDDKARDFYSQALGRARQLGNREMESNSHNALGSIARRRGELNTAEDQYRAALTIDYANGNNPNIASRLNNLALVLRDKGDLGGALDMFDKSLKLARTMNDDVRVAQRLSNIGEVLKLKGDLGAARDSLEEALAVSKRIDDKHGRAEVLVALGQVLLEQGEPGPARNALDEALALRQKLDQPDEAATVQVALARLALAEDRPGDAARMAGAAVVELARLERRSHELAAWLVLVQARLGQNQLDRARHEVGQAEELARDSQSMEQQLWLRLVAARVRAAGGEGKELKAAMSDLEATRRDAEAKGFGEVTLQARLAWIKQARLAGSEVGTELANLIVEADRRGFARVAAQARAWQPASKDSHAAP